MDSPFWIEWLALGLFLALGAFGAAADVVANSIGRPALGRWRENTNGNTITLGLFNQPALALFAILLLNIIGIIGATTLTTMIFVGYLGSGSLWVSTATAFLAVLLLSQLAPRIAVSGNIASAARWMVGPLQAFFLLVSPFLNLAALLLTWARRLPALGTQRTGNPAVAEMLAPLVGLSPSEEVEEEEEEMIQAIFSMGETTAREVMVPRIDIVAVESHATVADVVETITQRWRSRLPVYDQSIDNIVGILHVRDLFAPAIKGETLTSISDLVRPAYFVPETKKVGELLAELREKNIHMAILVDEYGGTAGLVTIEDLLEEIVGEIRDEYGREEAKIQQLNEREAIVDASVSIDDVNEALGLDLIAGDIDTIGGLVYHTLGKLPELGETFSIDNTAFTVLSLAGRRIGKVRIQRQRP
ncbi:MAG: HlyC/CorC family transporter [Chloroflexi bacterium]|nr:HlyC/CorC family transporter [Chloroflexota bacterium]